MHILGFGFEENSYHYDHKKNQSTLWFLHFANESIFGNSFSILK